MKDDNSIRFRKYFIKILNKKLLVYPDLNKKKAMHCYDLKECNIKKKNS